MPGKVKVKIVSGRNLPVMDRSNLTTDAYVEVKLGSTVYKTDVYRKSLNPVWNSEWFRFEMDDLELQDEPLQIRLMDHDTYSSNDAIGKVYLDLNPLLCNSSRGKDSSGKMISGWIPVYDTMHGIRGEVNLIVKVELFSDLNKFRQSSCGVRFFFTQSVPEGYIAHTMQGFVEELVVNDDPEYQWIDKIRTPRASNEARQTLFSKLSGEVQRRVGLKALELGGNAVIGYKQCFDLEGESGIVVRGIGTAAYLTKQYESQLSPTCGESLGMSREFAELQGYRSFSKNARSVRKRGGPGRPPRLQRRSFRVPNSADSMTGTHLLHQHNDGGTGRKMSHDDTCLLAHAASNFEVGNLVEPDSGAVDKHGSFEGFKERSSSFREDSAMKLMKLNLKKSLATSTQSVPHSSNSPAHKGVLNYNVSDSAQDHLPVTTSEPCIEVCSSQSGEGVTMCSSFTTVPGPCLQRHSKSQSHAPSSTLHNRSTSTRLPHTLSPLLRARHLECSSIVENDSDILLIASHTAATVDDTSSRFETTNHGRSALASCMIHKRSCSATIDSTTINQSLRNESERHLTNELPSSSAIVRNEHLLGLMSGVVSDVESTSIINLCPHVDAEIDEDSTSDTSGRYIYCTGLTGGRLTIDTEIESDTSKDFAKVSSGNDGCSVDNDELSPVSEREGFLLLKKKRGSRRKDRYSKSSLMKRASANFAEKGYLLGGTEKIKEEVVKFFKRKKSSDDNESCSSGTKIGSSGKKCVKTRASPYREAKFFFRRRRTTSNNPKNIPLPLGVSGRSKSSSHLFRSNSDSHSLGQTSLDSMPSVGSEPVFDPEEDDSSHDVSNSDAYLHEKLTVSVTPKLQLPEFDEEHNNIPEARVMVDTKENYQSTVTPNPANVLELNRSKIVEIIKELGYSTAAPLKLYISSMDALLVYHPSDESSTASSGTLLADRGGGASACSQSSALPTGIFRPDAECDLELSQIARGDHTFSSQASSSSKVCGTPSPRSHNTLCRQETVKFVPSSILSRLSESDTSAMTSFSTINSYTTRTDTNDSFSSNTSESASCLHALNQVISGHCSSCRQGSFSATTSNCARTNVNSRCAMCSPDTTGAISKIRPNQGQYDSSHHSSFKLDDEVEEPVDKTEGILFSNTKLGHTDEDIILVVPSSDSRSREGKLMDKDDFNYNMHDNIEHMRVTRCRSPIPEELLCDRSTPTHQSNSNQSNTLTGGNSNFNISTITNSIVHHTPASSATMNANCVNVPQGSVAHGETVTFVNANATTTTNSTNNSACSTMICGGANTSTSKVANSSEDNSAVAVHDNGSSAIGNLDESATKTSLVSSSFCPSHPCDPLHHHHHHSQVAHSHRHGLKEMHSSGRVASDALVLDTDCTVGGDVQMHPNDRNGNFHMHNKAIPKIPPSSAYHISHQNVKNQVPAPMVSPFAGHNHVNMTTTIITSATGTAPMTNSGSGVLHRRSSESDLSTPPKPSTMSAHLRNFPGAGLKPGITAVDQYGLMEYPFITVSQFPPGFLTHIGGTVTARSVKLLERISNLDEPESRDAWWNEIRMEIRAHCRAFGCTVVVGYEEHTTMCDDVCVLSASGTAAIATTTIGIKNVELLTVSAKQGTQNPVIVDAPCPGRGVEKDRAVLTKLDSVINSAASNGALKHILVTPSAKLRHDSDQDPNCSMLHIPSNPAALPFPVKMSRCHVCRKGRVPDVLIVTVDIPPGLHITGKGTLIQAQVFRSKKDCKGEISAKEVSDSLPFLEYELHRRLINKLKVKGMNAIFGLKVQICLGDKLMVAVATGTAMFVTALPPPGVPIITAGNMKTDAQKVLQYQKVVQDAYDRNRQHYDLKPVSIPTNGRQSGSSDGEDSEEDENTEIQCSNKDTYILEVDDAEDIDIISMLIDPHPTTGFLMNNIDYLHGYEEQHVSSQQMFTQVWRCRIPTLSLRQFTAYFERLIRSVSFKLRKMMPCVLSKLSFRVELPEPDEMQIAIIGLALSMSDQSKITALMGCEKASSVRSGSILSVAKEESELMFSIEDDGGGQSQTSGSTSGNVSNSRPTDLTTSTSESVSRDHPRVTPPIGVLVPAGMHHSLKTKLVVEITPLSYIPGARIEKYLGNLNFFFIRETTSIRENGGLSGFVHNFVAEILAIVRAHVAALGGNAMVSYFMTELALLHNPHKNQGQCLINVGGDVVLIVHPSHFTEDSQLGS